MKKIIFIKLNILYNLEKKITKKKSVQSNSGLVFSIKYLIITTKKMDSMVENLVGYYKQAIQNSGLCLKIRIYLFSIFFFFLQIQEHAIGF
jgi:hypothetical protein